MGLSDFASPGDSFFAEWRMETSGPRQAIATGAPAGIVFDNSFGDTYHFLIARDQVRFLRDALLPILYVDIEPDVPHVYRLELLGDQAYSLYIDNTLIDFGVPEGGFFEGEPNVVFGARAYLDGSDTTRWDYIRFGTIVPEPGTGVMLLAGCAALGCCRKRRRRLIA